MGMTVEEKEAAEAAKSAENQHNSRTIVFLGGTAAKSDWRDRLLARLADKGTDVSGVFNPVVADWNAEAQANEERAKKEATTQVYYIASPQQEGNPLSAYSMVEATMALYDHPESTLVVFDMDGLEGHPLKAMLQTERVLRARFPQAKILDSLGSLVNTLDELLT